MSVREKIAEKRLAAKPPTNAEQPAPTRELIISALAGKAVKPVKYLVPGRIPAGKLILCGARGGSGKSTLWRRIASDLSVGRCALGLSYPNPVRCKTLILAAEDGPEDTILPGLLAEGADVSRIAIVEGVRRGNSKSDFTLARADVELLQDRLSKSPDIKLIVIDPIASFVGRCKVDDHRAAELRLILDPLSALAESSGATIAMIAHLNKSNGEAVDRIAGSAAYRDAVRAAYLVSEDPDDDSRRLLMPVKENLPGFDRTAIPFAQVPLTDAEAETVMRDTAFQHLVGEDRQAVRQQLRRLRFDTAVSVDPNAAMKSKKTDGTKVQRCKEWLKQFLARYAYPSDEILAAAKLAGFTFDNIKESKAELKTYGLRNSNRGVLRGAWWSGFGDPETWTLRPESTPYSPLSPLSPLSPDSPH